MEKFEVELSWESMLKHVLFFFVLEYVLLFYFWILQIKILKLYLKIALSVCVRIDEDQSSTVVSARWFLRGGVKVNRKK